ncbi:hypothetical protein Bca52824_022880 [Brassica carinata]|uniref:Uncharacterized protein n=1 Tax=Brassica carinata TaxID=52824 RepID=A0A8X7VHJ3_BRACI|nr:hypothetical protein Bca52824_022880 [Brassica carinata]
MTDMADPYYAERKQHKREADWLHACVYANYCIPTKCTCGEAITADTDERGRNYYVCKVYEDDRLHTRHDCLAAIEEELKELKSQYDYEVSLRRKLQYEIVQMRKDIEELKKLCYF